MAAPLDATAPAAPVPASAPTPSVQLAKALVAGAVTAPADPSVAVTAAPAGPAIAPFLSKAASATALPAASTPAASGPGEIAPRALERVEGLARRAAVRRDEAPARAERPNLERAAAILRQIRSHLTRGTRRLELELEPRDLGRVSIQLATRDGRVRAIVRAESAETLAVLERHAPELAAAFEAQGLEAESFELHHGFTDAHGQRSAGHEQHETRHAHPARATNTSDLETQRPHARAVVTDGGLDTWA